MVSTKIYKEKSSPSLLLNFLCGVAVVLVGSLLVIPSAEAQTSWIGTQTHAHPTGTATFVEYLADNETIDVVVALKLRNSDQFNQQLAAVTTRGNPLFRHWLTPVQVLSNYAPTQEQAQAVANYLSQSGFGKVAIEPNRLLVTASGTAAAVRRAFNTEIGRFVRNGHQGIANTKDALVPSALSGTILAVLGLQTIDQMHPVAVQTHNPVTFPTIYNGASLPAASNTAVGIITEGSMTQTISDLHTFETDNSLPTINPTVVNVGGTSTDTSGTEEWDIDSQDIQGMAGGTVKQMLFYTATALTDAALTATFNKAVTDNIAKVINISLGECETTPYADGSMSADDAIFSTAIMQGQTISVASGDTGAYECGTGGVNGSSYGSELGDSYPASSPYVIAVGGTTLSTSGTGSTYSSETAWAYGGGGPSLYEAQPSWQSGIVSGTKRGVPDVAFDANPSSGVLFIYDGSQTSNGGTSLASPLFVGAWARIESAHNNALGFAAPWIYSLAKESPAAFNDVTSGSNGYYSAGVGWDYTTGWGSLNVAAVSAAVTKKTAAIQAIINTLLLN
jgi:pseudomonalisin